MNYFCMYQQIGNTKIIFGIGKSEQEAKEDAELFAENIDGLKCVECTDDVYNYVFEHGGESGCNANFRINESGIMEIYEG